MAGNERKPSGRPRKTAAGGSAITFYLPKEAQEYIRAHGGAKWICEKIREEKEKNNV
ncbi:hypothetical protein [uncultured Parasutterella sp.]|uniref:hypothetical protein n=1 Tax=uncultured Parasutterella sp. TaxID=1263098 RepID=UPI00272A346E|nr:hypothetical protein [uncultured Parasutterella sp.]